MKRKDLTYKLTVIYYKFTFSFYVGMFIIIYLLKLPHKITGKPDIVNEYYKNIKNIFFDYCFVTAYFLIAQLVIYLMNIEDNLYKVLVTGIITAILTSGFCYYFKSLKMTSNFFSIWFHTVGYSSVLYDIILLCFIYCIYLYLDNWLTNV